jgi:hypothetical protein
MTEIPHRNLEISGPNQNVLGLSINQTGDAAALLSLQPPEDGHLPLTYLLSVSEAMSVMNVLRDGLMRTDAPLPGGETVDTNPTPGERTQVSCPECNAMNPVHDAGSCEECGAQFELRAVVTASAEQNIPK